MTRQKIRLQLKVELDRIDYSALTWYQDATKLIRQLYGKHADLFCSILAATSPRSQVKKNWRIASAIVVAYVNRKDKPGIFGDVLASVMISNLPNTIRALQGRPLSGPKVSRFAENLKGNLDVVTIDMWVRKAYGIVHEKLTPALYARLEKKIISDAKRTNATPAGLQAVIWSAIRREAGLRAKSFVSVYRSISMETPYFAFMNEE